MVKYLNVSIPLRMLMEKMAKTDIKVNNLIKLNILLLLSKGKVHGYEVIKVLEQNLGVKISASQVYPFLGLLKRQGHIDYSKTDKRDKKDYFLTKQGKEFMKGISAKFSSIIDFAVQSKVKRCAHCGCDVYKGGHEERFRSRLLYFCCRNCASFFSPLSLTGKLCCLTGLPSTRSGGWGSTLMMNS